MYPLILRRLAWIFLVLWAVNAASFLATSYLALRQGEQVRTASFGGRELVFPDPTARYELSPAEVLATYVEYLRGMFRGELGSMPDGTSVPRHVLDVLPPSLVLLGAATAVSLLAGTLIGLSSVGRVPGRPRPRALAFNVFGFSMPAFYVGIVGIQLSLVLARVLDTRAVVLPSMGYGFDRHLLLPVLALALRPTAEIARLTSESLSAELRKDYVRKARAVGQAPRRVLLRHAWFNVVGAVMAAQGNAMRYLISSLIVVELLFKWPGLGRELALALTPRVDGRPSASILYDPYLVAGLCTALAALSLGVGLITSIVAKSVDPRLRT